MTLPQLKGRPMTDPIDLSKEFIRLSALESGLSLALDPLHPVASAKVPQPSSTARIALESILLDAVSDPPCYVLFSGGRDSSAVLAVAAHVARREGLPDPIPVTAIHPAASKTDETPWQAMVLDHHTHPGADCPVLRWRADTFEPSCP